MLSGVGVRLRTNANIAFRCAYQVVWCPKYRRKVIGGPMEQRLKEIIAEVISEKGAWLIELETMADQVHLLVEVDPQFGVHKLVKAIKARSSRLLVEDPSTPGPLPAQRCGGQVGFESSHLVQRVVSL